MQTFLPYEDFSMSAAVLDRSRLGKQRVEAWQILRALQGKTKGWVNHPATRMWAGAEYHLCLYGIVICTEWVQRGYNDTLLPKFWMEFAKYDCSPKPSWLGNPAFHASHRSVLLHKDADWYGNYLWEEEPSTQYVWPVK